MNDHGAANGLSLLSLKLGRVLIMDSTSSLHWNEKLAKQIGSEPDMTHQALKRFEKRGWIQSTREAGSIAQLGHMPRKLFSITEAGAVLFRNALDQLQLAST
jgi:DNA-binding MarR family transcriptional regulator